jgi:formylglycine-generating enzyme required for sulfatase activity
MLVRPGEQADAEGRALGYWPTLYAYVFKHRDRDFQKQQLQVDAQRWSERGGLGRWFGLAGWRDRTVFRRLRPRKGSLAGRYLSRSRWVARGQAVLLAGFLGVLGESAWWADKNTLPIGYALIKPLWATGLYTPLPEMVRIPSGSFVMGCVEGRDDVEGYKCEKLEFGLSEVPTRKVMISRDFGLGKYEITFMQYDYFVWDQQRGGENINFPNAEDWGRYRLPVVNVSWEDANTYLQWLSLKIGETYRLPTEAEWEYAARAGTDTAFSSGRSIGGNVANCIEHLCKDNFSYTSPVGSFLENPFGLHDMHGNVYEWVADWLADYPDSGVVSDPKGPDIGTSRVLRGGSWNGTPQNLRSASRDLSTPVHQHFHIGFRPAQVYSKQSK